MSAVWAKVVLSPHGANRWGSDNLEVAQMKKCSKCGEPKSLDQFGNRAVSPDGLHPRCKACRAVEGRGYRLTNRAKIRASNKEYRVAHRDETNAISREWATDNPDKRRTTTREYANANPEKIRLKCLRRRVRQKANGIFVVTVKEYKWLLARLCYLCEVAPSATIDHIIPVARGGRHAIGNFLGACGSCNCSKNDMLLVEYRRFQRRRNQPRGNL